MTTSVVIVSYRPHDRLVRAISSVAGQADEVIVVDNGSADEEVSAIARRHDVRIVRVARNLGFAGGANVGLRATRGDVIGVLNDDAAAGPRWLERSTVVLERPEVGAVAPKVLLSGLFAEVRPSTRSWYQPPDPRRLGEQLHTVTVAGVDVLARLLGGVHRVEHDLGEPARRWRWTVGSEPVFVPLDDSDDVHDVVVNGERVSVSRVVRLINSAGGYLSKEGFGGDRGSDGVDDGRFDDAGEVFSAPGSAFVTRRDILDDVGLFAPGYFTYYEDLDWSWRVRLGGYEIRYEPEQTVDHDKGATSGGPGDIAVRRFASRNRLRTLARNAPLPVVTRQVRRSQDSDHRHDYPPALVARALARGLADRPVLTHRRRLHPVEVWARWAGVNERWSGSADTGDGLVPPRLQFDG